MRLLNILILNFSMIVGGFDDKNRYREDLELLTPGLLCHQNKLSTLPLKVAGAPGDLVRNGQTLIYEGGVHSYTGCTATRTGFCEKNIECVETKGGSKWYFGPRTTDCYTYEYK